MTRRHPLALSPMHYIHVASGAFMDEQDGWLRVLRYSSIDEEIEQITNGVGLIDFSQAGKLLLNGEDVDSWMRQIYGEGGELEVGSVWRSEIDGYAVEENMAAARLSRDEILALMSPGHSEPIMSFLKDSIGDCAHVVDITSVLCSIRITGANAQQLLSRVTDLHLQVEAFRDMSCVQGRVADVQSVVIRHDIGGLQSYELYFGRDYGQYMWETLTESGHDLNVVPYGVEALERLVSGS